MLIKQPHGFATSAAKLSVWRLGAVVVQLLLLQGWKRPADGYNARIRGASKKQILIN
jgi:hypothetical protein